ncbi:GNAT family N-acetyltransferase [Rhodococcus sp. ARC_M13]|uniref:GNAT family N-acetyltransferase n=1 Tax=unclassified Rhodococcus (in: high G+C Gram-positive bacteria) TaxID=192944 RepID=UPI001FB2099A|nr:MULTISPECIES: GNAT family N-acetyltransferase [unclassified Rhodococcus (in: high G+C Gram-positive bacteria)]MCJ0899168.1 GNAT family N-acetyltransferase [Rhodococcus sp. ARC_M13]MCJ0948948.1 GNAT family N-acetyltransferase [Rhodococcus sp. ARC_M8]
MTESADYCFHQAHELDDHAWQTLLATLDSDEETRLDTLKYADRAWSNRQQLVGRREKSVYEVVAAADGERYVAMIAGRPAEGFVAILGRVKEAKGNGLGEKLLDHFVKLAQQHGARRLRTRLDPRESGLEKRKALARQYGFMPCETAPGDLIMSIDEVDADTR